MNFDQLWETVVRMIRAHGSAELRADIEEHEAVYKAVALGIFNETPGGNVDSSFVPGDDASRGGSMVVPTNAETTQGTGEVLTASDFERMWSQEEAEIAADVYRGHVARENAQRKRYPRRDAPAVVDEASETALVAHFRKQAAITAAAVVAELREKTERKLEGATLTHLDYAGGGVMTVLGQIQGRNVRMEQIRVLKASSKGNLFHQWPARLYVDGQFVSETEYDALFGKVAAPKEKRKTHQQVHEERLVDLLSRAGSDWRPKHTQWATGTGGLLFRSALGARVKYRVDKPSVVERDHNETRMSEGDLISMLVTEALPPTPETTQGAVTIEVTASSSKGETGWIRSPIKLYRSFDTRALEQYKSTGEIAGRGLHDHGMSSVEELNNGASYTANLAEALSWAERWLKPGTHRVAAQHHTSYRNYADVLAKVPADAAYWRAPGYIIAIEGKGRRYFREYGHGADPLPVGTHTIPVEKFATTTLGVSIRADWSEVLWIATVDSDGIPSKPTHSPAAATAPVPVPPPAAPTPKAPQGSRVVRLSTDREGAMTLTQAREWVWEAASMLAAKPPPGPGLLNDEVGLSASTWGPVTTFVRNGPEQMDAAYYAVCEYLLPHKDTQLDGKSWSAARDVLRASTPLTLDQAKELVKGGARTTAKGGENANGTWEVLDGGKVELKLKLSRKHGGMADVLRAAGLKSPIDFEWRVVSTGKIRYYDGKDEKEYFLVVHPHALARVVELLEANGREAMATALRASGVVDVAAEVPPPPQPRQGVIDAMLAAVDAFEPATYYGKLWSKGEGAPTRIYINDRGDKWAKLGNVEVTATPGKESWRDWTQFPPARARRFNDAMSAAFKAWQASQGVVAEEPRPVSAPTGGVELEPMGSNFKIRGPLDVLRAEIVPFDLRESASAPGWYVVPKQRAETLRQALAGGTGPVARALLGTVKAAYDAHELHDVATLDDPRVSPGTRAAVREVMDSITWPPGVALYPPQEVGAGFAILRGKALIGDDMGVGKTIQTIAVIKYANVPTLVVCPNSALYAAWAKDLKAFAPELKVTLITSSMETIVKREQVGWTKPKRKADKPRPKFKVVSRTKEPVTFPPAEPGHVIVTTWGLMEAMKERFLEWKPVLVAMDEAQAAKNYKAKRTIAAFALAKQAKRVVLLTGTPAENQGSDIFSMLHLLDPIGWPYFKPFATTYFQATPTGYGGALEVGALDPDRADEFKEKLARYIVRRTKQVALPFLPAKTRSYEWMPLGDDDRKEYGAIIEAFQQQRLIEEQAGVEPSPAAMLNLLGELRRKVGMLKVPQTLEWVVDFFDAAPDESLVVFAEHQIVIAALQAGLTAAGITHRTIDGSTSARERGGIIAAFQAGEFRVIIGSKALYAAATLTRASHMVFHERWWVPTWEEQAEDRIHRIGTKNAVTIHYPMLEGTIDRKMHELILRKREDISHVVDIDVHATTVSAADAKKIGMKQVFDEIISESWAE